MCDQVQQSTLVMLCFMMETPSEASTRESLIFELHECYKVRYDYKIGISKQEHHSKGLEHFDHDHHCCICQAP
jgi:hypothetical protein